MVAASPAPTGSARAVPVEVRALSHQFVIKGTPLPVLEEISFTVEPGAFVALLGPSGCGKSTLLRLAAGLERPTGGAILVDGRQVTGPDPARALVFQDPTLYPWRTVWRNVALGLEARGILRKDDPRIHETLERVGLASFARAHPHQLSGGMAQRVALARALVNEPSLFLLDEPLGQLDALTRVTMQRELLRLWEAGSFTALLVTHDVDEALYLADRVLVLSVRPGRVIGEVLVDAQRPRHHADPRFQELRKQVLALLGFDWT
jgi:NitT/TauT family transport system ATP-binding protein